MLCSSRSENGSQTITFTKIKRKGNKIAMKKKHMNSRNMKSQQQPTFGLRAGKCVAAEQRFAVGVTDS